MKIRNIIFLFATLFFTGSVFALPALAPVFAKLGTAVHEACERYLKGKIVNGGGCEWEDEFNKRMMQFEHWVNSFKPEVITQEYQMYHPDVPFSGTPDIVAYIPEHGLCLIDIKTGAPYENHELQLTCYKMLWDTLFPDTPITNI